MFAPITCSHLCKKLTLVSCLLLLLQAFVVGRLQDSKVEVRGLSAATLSGIIKALPAHEMDSLRRTMLANVTRLFNIPPPGSRGNKRGSSRGVPVVAAAAAAAQLDAAGAAAFAAQQGPVFLAEAQAVVQGLKAFVLSSPYDVPGWMPEVLLALVAAANSRNPLVRCWPCFVCVVKFLSGWGGLHTYTCT